MIFWYFNLWNHFIFIETKIKFFIDFFEIELNSEINEDKSAKGLPRKLGTNQITDHADPARSGMCHGLSHGLSDER